MGTRNQKKELTAKLYNYFLEEGKILTKTEYGKAENKPVSFYGINNVAGNYHKAIEMTQIAYPDLDLLIAVKQRDEILKNMEALKVPKPPVVEVKPAEKSAVKQDEDDE